MQQVNKSQTKQNNAKQKLCIKLVHKPITAPEFKTSETSKLLKQTSKYEAKAKTEQIGLQQDLEYNLRNKANNMCNSLTWKPTWQNSLRK